MAEDELSTNNQDSAVWFGTDGRNDDAYRAFESVFHVSVNSYRREEEKFHVFASRGGCNTLAAVPSLTYLKCLELSRILW